MWAIQKYLAIEYRPINLAVIILVPLLDSNVTHYSNLVFNWLRTAKSSSTFPIQIHRLMATFKLKRVSGADFQLKCRHQPTPTTHLDKHIVNIDIFFSLFLGGISCDSSSLTRMAYNVVMTANFKMGALYREAWLYVCFVI
jgi:hypothetical protein